MVHILAKLFPVVAFRWLPKRVKIERPRTPTHNPIMTSLIKVKILGKQARIKGNYFLFLSLLNFLVCRRIFHFEIPSDSGAHAYAPISEDSKVWNLFGSLNLAL